MGTHKRIFIVLILVIIFVGVNNHIIAMRRETVSISNLPGDMNALKIVHLSDLHGFTANWYIHCVVTKVRNENPDLIVFTGDLLDSKTANISPSVSLMSDLTKFAPVFFVPGNHDYGSGQSLPLFDALEAGGIIVLRDGIHTLDFGASSMIVVGVDDPLGGSSKDDCHAFLHQVKNEAGHPILIAAHRPESFLDYCQINPSIILAGHAHGGQFRLPLIGPFFAPHQGFFPLYTEGPYTKKNATMIVSRGLANSHFPLRLNNLPEIVVITLSSSSDL